MPDIEVSLEGVVKLLKELNPNKASGPDGIPAHILKLAAEEVAPALCFFSEITGHWCFTILLAMCQY